MEDYRANSHKAKAEAKEAAEKKVDKVVTGNVKRKKKSEVSKFKDVFISEDVSNVRELLNLQKNGWNIISVTATPVKEYNYPDYFDSTLFTIVAAKNERR